MPPNSASSANNSVFAFSAETLNVISAYQAQFHQRWNHLNDPHVRALAWLLDAPDLLDGQAPQWQGKIAHILNQNERDQIAIWLHALDSEPIKLEELHFYIGSLPSTRLGLYAEKLMAFYFHKQKMLVAHSLQVRAAKNDTVGEFDFLLRRNDALVHWEFATKFYLLETSQAGFIADDFVGPNLADSLGAKVNKILERQLTLSSHPAAQIHLAEAVTSAQALIKGWLFYQDPLCEVPGTMGIAKAHCRGYWRGCSDVLASVNHGADGSENNLYAILPRLRWLAPAKIKLSEVMTAAQVREVLADYFASQHSPLILATLRQQGDHALEVYRGFVVPDDWSSKAAQTRKLAVRKIL